MHIYMLAIWRVSSYGTNHFPNFRFQVIELCLLSLLALIPECFVAVRGFWSLVFQFPDLLVVFIDRITADNDDGISWFDARFEELPPLVSQVLVVGRQVEPLEVTQTGIPLCSTNTQKIGVSIGVAVLEGSVLALDEGFQM